MRRLLTSYARSGIWRGVLGLCIVFVAGCSVQKHAVVLWPHGDSALKSGAVVRAGSAIDREGKVEVITAEGDRHRLNEWQIERFISQDELNEFLELYSEHLHTFAQCEKKALPLRQDADRFSDILYRLDEGEVVKIIDRDSEISNEAGLEDYWYYALTSSGVRGWVFGYHLSIIDAKENAVVAGKDVRENIALFLNNTWRPAYFREMLATNSFDLTRFAPTFGLFPAPLEDTIDINLPNYFFRVVYRTPLPEHVNVFYFGENNELKITLQSADTVVAEVNDPTGEVQTFRFHLFAEDIQRIVNFVRAEARSAR